MTIRRVALILLAAVILPACQSAVEEAAPAPTPDAVPLTISLTQIRRHQGTSRIAVKVGNEGTSPVRIERVALDVAGFGPADPSTEDALLRPGVRADLPIVLGEARCDGGSPSSAGESTVVVSVRPDGGPRQDVRVVLPPDIVLDELLDEQCTLRAIREAVDIHFGESWTLEGTTLLGSIEMRRLESEEPIALTGIAGTVLYNLRPAPEGPSPLLVLDPAADVAELPVQITAARCDGHALSQSSQSFLFSAWVSMDGDPEQHAPLIPPEDAREPYLELTRVACGL